MVALINDLIVPPRSAFCISARCRNMIPIPTTTTTTTAYFNKVVFPSVLGLTSPMASSTFTCPKHLPYKVPSFSYLLSTLLSISSWAYLSLHYHLPAVSQFSLSNTTHLSFNMTKPPQPVSLHHFSNIINFFLVGSRTVRKRDS